MGDTLVQSSTHQAAGVSAEGAVLEPRPHVVTRRHDERAHLYDARPVLGHTLTALRRTPKSGQTVS